MKTTQESNIDERSLVSRRKSAVRFLDTAKLGRILVKNTSFKRNETTKAHALSEPVLASLPALLLETGLSEGQNSESDPCASPVLHTEDDIFIPYWSNDSTPVTNAFEKWDADYKSVTSQEGRLESDAESVCSYHEECKIARQVTEDFENNEVVEVSCVLDSGIINSPDPEPNAPIYHWYLDLLNSLSFKQSSVALIAVGLISISLSTLAAGIMGASAGVVLVAGIMGVSVGAVGLTASLSQGFFKPLNKPAYREENELTAKFFL